MDASDTYLGAFLQQLLDSSWALFAFFSKKLSDAEKKYSAFHRELPTAYCFLHHFRFMFEVREFTIFKVHKPLKYVLFRVSPPWSACQQCHLSYLAEFTSSSVLVPGPENVVANALSQPFSIPSPSRVALVQDSGLTPFKEFLPGSASSLLSPAPSLSSFDAPVISGFDISLLPLLQLTCPSVSEMCSSLSLSLFSVLLGAGVLLCDSSTGSLHPLVPLQLRRQLFNLVHDVAHPGVHASWRPVSSKFVWPGLS